MAQFTVCRNKNPQTASAVPFLLDIQNDLLDRPKHKPELTAHTASTRRGTRHPPPRRIGPANPPRVPGLGKAWKWKLRELENCAGRCGPPHPGLKSWAGHPCPCGTADRFSVVDEISERSLFGEFATTARRGRQAAGWRRWLGRQTLVAKQSATAATLLC